MLVLKVAFFWKSGILLAISFFFIVENLGKNV